MQHPSSSSGLEYLRWLWHNPTERQTRHLELRRRFTVALTAQAQSTEAWAIPLITASLQASPVYREQLSLLDVGCGGGYYLAALLAEPELRMRLGLGVDLNADVLQAAQARLDRVAGRSGRLVRGDARRLPLRPASFGAALCNRMLNQTGDIAGVLAAVAESLVAEGLLFIVTADRLETSWLRSSHEANLQNLGFPARLYRHSTPADQRFSLDNGPQWLAPHFEKVKTNLYERRLTFRQSADLLEYYATGLLFQKSAGFQEPDVAPENWLKLYEAMAELARPKFTVDGHLTLADGAALFDARRPA